MGGLVLNNILVDFLGQELHIGDNVVYCRHERTSSKLTKTKIIGFTDKMVKIENGSWGNVWPDKLIKYSKTNVNDQQKLSDIVDDALSELDGINSSGDLKYDVYSDIHNIISNIYNRFIEE